MYYVTKTFQFAAAHRLANYKGKCANLHGHTYQLEVTIRGKKLNSIGLLMDFGQLKQIVEDLIISKCDHTLLNESTLFTDLVNTTAECMVTRIYGILYQALNIDNCGAELYRVRLWETPTSVAEVCYG